MEKFGNKDKNIIFLHGGGPRYRAYLPLIKQLASNYSVYSFDMPSHGKSPAIDQVDEAINYVYAQIRSLDLKEMIIIGHSFGGFCAYQVAKRLDNISHMILIDPLIFKLKLSKLELLVSFLVTKNLHALILHPSIITFYTSALFDIISNLFLQNINIIKTLKLLFRSAHWQEEVNLDNLPVANIRILFGKNDSIINPKYLPENLKKFTTFVDGEHDWCMADVKKTAEIIKQIIDDSIQFPKRSLQ